MSIDKVCGALTLFALSVCCWAASPQIAFNDRTIQRICVPNAEIHKPMPVPVGCKLVDCCPGCPGAGAFRWVIQINASFLQGAELRFEGMPTEGLRRLTLSGNARLDGDRIILDRGVSVIDRIPERIDGKIAVGSLAPRTGKNPAPLLPRARPTGRIRAAGAGKIVDDITVGQFRGGRPVNDFRWRHIIRPCTPTPPLGSSDTLVISNVGAGQSVVVMLDARTAAGAGGCGNDHVFPSTGNNIVGNLLLGGGCNSELAVFSATNKMLFQSPVATWTDTPMDVHTTPPLEPVIPVPVSVWIAPGVLEARARDEFNNANLLYRQNRVGVLLLPVFRPFPVELDHIIKNGGCARIADIKDHSDGDSRFFTPGELNVYYSNAALYGRNCAIVSTPQSCPGSGNKGDGNITLIGSLVSLVAPAHELGHAFGLRPGPCGGHTNKFNAASGAWENLPGFDDDSIMRSEAPDLAGHFTLGQVFRMNTHKDEWDGTMLIHNGQRPITDRRPCPPDVAATAVCPGLATDWP